MCRPVIQERTLIMVVDSHCNHLLCLFLSNDILVQPALYNVRGRDILHGKDRLFLGLLLNLLLLRYLHGGRGCVQVTEVHVHIWYITQL